MGLMGLLLLLTVLLNAVWADPPRTGTPVPIQEVLRLLNTDLFNGINGGRQCGGLGDPVSAKMALP